MHTIKGHYLLLRANEEASQDVRAKVGIILQSKSTTCQMRMWFIKTAESNMTLHVYMKNLLKRKIKTLANISTAAVQHWTRVEVNIPKEDNNIQVS